MEWIATFSLEITPQLLSSRFCGIKCFVEGRAWPWCELRCILVSLESTKLIMTRQIVATRDLQLQTLLHSHNYSQQEITQLVSVHALKCASQSKTCIHPRKYSTYPV